jgi:competence protein CoiA
MKYSLINGERCEAQPGLYGQCRVCGQPTVAKCGKVKIWHWAHKSKQACDSWKENETEWHRNWKNYFPDHWQEHIHIAESGEKHIADVKTIKDWVIEFQHSYIKPEEREIRSNFYKKMVWVVNGARRKRDKSKFFESLQEVTTVSNPDSPVRRIFKVLWDDCALFRDWLNCPAPIFFDFDKEDPVLWCLFPQDSNGKAYVLEFLRAGFITFQRNELVEKDFFFDLIKNFKTTIAGLSSPPPTPIQNILLSPRPQYNRPYRRTRFIRK